MAGKAGTVYIKADRNVEVAKTSVMIGDVLKIECTDPAMLARIRSIHLLTFHHPDDKRQRRTDSLPTAETHDGKRIETPCGRYH